VVLWPSPAAIQTICLLIHLGNRDFRQVAADTNAHAHQYQCPAERAERPPARLPRFRRNSRHGTPPKPLVISGALLSFGWSRTSNAAGANASDRDPTVRQGGDVHPKPCYAARHEMSDRICESELTDDSVLCPLLCLTLSREQGRGRGIGIDRSELGN
jgi:hypothetical protein